MYSSEEAEFFSLILLAIKNLQRQEYRSVAIEPTTFLSEAGICLLTLVRLREEIIQKAKVDVSSKLRLDMTVDQVIKAISTAKKMIKKDERYLIGDQFKEVPLWVQPVIPLSVNLLTVTHLG